MGPLLGTFSLGAYLGKGALQYFSKRCSWYKCCWSYLDTNVRIDTMGSMKGHGIATVVILGG